MIYLWTRAAEQDAVTKVGPPSETLDAGAQGHTQSQPAPAERKLNLKIKENESCTNEIQIIQYFYYWATESWITREWRLLWINHHSG